MLSFVDISQIESILPYGVNDHHRKPQSEMRSFLPSLLYSFQNLREAQHIFYVFSIAFYSAVCDALAWLLDIRYQIPRRSNQFSLPRVQPISTTEAVWIKILRLPSIFPSRNLSKPASEARMILQTNSILRVLLEQFGGFCATISNQSMKIMQVYFPTCSEACASLGGTRILHVRIQPALQCNHGGCSMGGRRYFSGCYGEWIVCLRPVNTQRWSCEKLQGRSISVLFLGIAYDRGLWHLLTIANTGLQGWICAKGRWPKETKYQVIQGEFHVSSNFLIALSTGPVMWLLKRSFKMCEACAQWKIVAVLHKQLRPSE